MRQKTGQGLQAARTAAQTVVRTAAIAAFALTLALAAAPTPAHAAESVQIKVADYGAVPNDGKDDVEAVVQALKAAQQEVGSHDGAIQGTAENVTVVFPAGTLDLYPDKAPTRTLYVSNTTGWQNPGHAEKTIGVLVENMRNVTLDGQGSTLMFHGKMTTLASIDSSNVTFKNFEIAFKVPTVIDLTVESVEGNSAIVTVPECYNYTVANNNVTFSSDVSPYTKQAYWTLSKNNGINYTQRYDTVQGLTWRGSTGNGSNPLFNAQTVEEVADHTLKYTWNQGVPSEVTPGLCYQMRNTLRDHPGAFFWQSKDVVLQNLDVRFLHGFGMVGQFSENITLNDVDFEADKAAGLTSAGSADFIQMSGCKGVIDISRCTFSNPHDDPINVHGTYLKVTDVSGDEVTVRYMHQETAGSPTTMRATRSSSSAAIICCRSVMARIRSRRCSRVLAAGKTSTVTRPSCGRSSSSWIKPRPGSLPGTAWRTSPTPPQSGFTTTSSRKRPPAASCAPRAGASRSRTTPSTAWPWPASTSLTTTTAGTRAAAPWT